MPLADAGRRHALPERGVNTAEGQSGEAYTAHLPMLANFPVSSLQLGSLTGKLPPHPGLLETSKTCYLLRFIQD